jgi:SAM-dependent methyltransferase
MDPFSHAAVQGAYDVAADDYAVAFADDLANLPLDCLMLDAAFASVRESGWIVEVGCGPAPAARYLADRTHHTLALDLSAEMLRVAGERNPWLPRVHADMCALPLRSRSCALVIAYYCVQHVPRASVPTALREMHRSLVAGGVLLVATHLGDGDVFSETFLGHAIDPVGGALYHAEELFGLLAEAGFAIEDSRQRGPLAHEHDTERIYILARAT